jgi:mRNA interferase MazF
MNPKRGEIWWVNLDPAQGAEIKKLRPCVVVPADWVNRGRKTPVVVPLSSSPAEAPPLVIAIKSAGRDSVAVIDQVRCVDKGRFQRTTGQLSAPDLEAVERGLRMVLEL